MTLIPRSHMESPFLQNKPHISFTIKPTFALCLDFPGTFQILLWTTICSFLKKHFLFPHFFDLWKDGNTFSCLLFLFREETRRCRPPIIYCFLGLFGPQHRQFTIISTNRKSWKLNQQIADNWEQLAFISKWLLWQHNLHTDLNLVCAWTDFTIHYCSSTSCELIINAVVWNILYAVL